MLPLIFILKTHKTEIVMEEGNKEEQNVAETKQPEKTNLPSSKPLREEISDLKSKLNDIGQKKEDWFKKKEDLKLDIAKLISQIKEARTNKEQAEVKIKELRENRDKFNKEVQGLIAKIKGMNTEKSPSAERKERPEAIKAKIDQLELSLETQAYDFEKEKKVMKQIHDLKKKHAMASSAEQANKSMRDVSKQIEEAKRKADEFHNQLKAYLKEQKEGSFGKLSKEINHIKKVQEDAFANFIKFKQEFAVINKLLKDKLGQVKAENEKAERDRTERKKEGRDREQHQIHEKVKEVKEKFKQKKMLTTEDLIALQGEPEDTEDF